MTGDWHDEGFTAAVRRLMERSEHMTDDVAVGGDLILLRSSELVPKESSDLADSGKVNKDRSGNNAVGITYDGPYARWIHEHLHFKHPHGGQAKFLEQALTDKGHEAAVAAGEHFFEDVQ